MHGSQMLAGKRRNKVLESWIERWAEGRIGWHEANGNASLRTYWRASGRRVLVPLCGKSVDMLWLAEQGNQVTGVELSELAIRAFFDENRLAYTVDDEEMRSFRALERPITIFCGDYFKFAADPFDAHFDRGALVAMPANLRSVYAEHTTSLLEPGAEQLLITVEYDQQAAGGPPYSVPASEVLGYWPELVRVDLRDDFANVPPKFIEAGLTEFNEVTWRSGGL